MLTKYQVADLLNEIADMLEFTGENVFKVNAYRNGADAIRKIEEDFESLVSAKKLDGIKGIGKGLQAVIYELEETGNSELIKDLKTKVPEGLPGLLKIRGLGAKKLQLLYNNLDIQSVDDLENACIEKKLTTVKGFGEKVQAKILEEIEKYKINRKYVLLNIALKYADEILAKLKKTKVASHFEITGELRRKCEIISAIEFLIEINNPSNISKIAETLGLTVEENTGTNAALYPVPVIFHFVSPEEYGWRLFYTTGSREFTASLLEGKSLSDNLSEDEIFTSTGRNYIIPEMRESEYFSYKQLSKDNSDLDLQGYKGLLHFHTTYSDGINSIEEMVTAGREFGAEYAVVCDHSKTAAYANGLTEERLKIQSSEIKQVADKLAFSVFQGIESDILGDGSLDFSSDILANFKFIVASVHSRFNLTEKEQTDRIIKAVENPYTNVLGHPTGRLLLSRDAYKVDIKKVIDACAACKTAIEINAHPNRLDLDWRWVYYAREKGCLFAINADAHSVDDILKTAYGVFIGRKAGLRKNEVINYLSLEQFEQFLEGKK
jgi:DNA polymerase (family 10)